MKKTEIYLNNAQAPSSWQPILMFPDDHLITVFDYEMKIVKKGADFCVGQTVYEVVDFQPLTESQPAKVLVRLK